MLSGIEEFIALATNNQTHALQIVLAISHWKFHDYYKGSYHSVVSFSAAIYYEGLIGWQSIYDASIYVTNKS